MSKQIEETQPLERTDKAYLDWRKSEDFYVFVAQIGLVLVGAGIVEMLVSWLLGLCWPIATMFPHLATGFRIIGLGVVGVGIVLLVWLGMASFNLPSYPPPPPENDRQ
jgi:hypothetical protein